MEKYIDAIIKHSQWLDFGQPGDISPKLRARQLIGIGAALQAEGLFIAAQDDEADIKLAKALMAGKLDKFIYN